MKLQRCALLLSALFGAASLACACASSSSPPTPTPTFGRPGAPPPSEWWLSVQDYFATDGMVIARQVLLSLLLFLAGWLVAKLIAFVV